MNTKQLIIGILIFVVIAALLVWLYNRRKAATKQATINALPPASTISPNLENIPDYTNTPVQVGTLGQDNILCFNPAAAIALGPNAYSQKSCDKVIQRGGILYNLTPPPTGVAGFCCYKKVV